MSAEEQARAIAAAHWRTAVTPRASLSALVGSAAEPLLPVPFTGSTAGGWSVPDARMAFFVANDTVRPALPHELMHLIAWQLWGQPSSFWMSEGLATVAAGPCRGYAVDDIVAAIDRAGRLPAFDALRFHFVYRDEQGAIEYFQAASLVAYIDRVGGRARLRALWRATNPGNEVAVIEPQWRAEIARHRAPAPWDTIFGSIWAGNCASRW